MKNAKTAQARKTEILDALALARIALKWDNQNPEKQRKVAALEKAYTAMRSRN